MEVHFADKFTGGGAIKRSQLSTRAHRFEDRNFVVVAGPLNTRVAFVVDGQAKLSAFAFKQQKLVKIEQRI